MNILPAHGGPLGHAISRSAPEDFLVSEELGFEPSGEGPHWYLHVEKAGMTTPWLIRQLSEWSGVNERDIGYSGLKDRHAISRQWISLPEDPKSEIDTSTFACEGATILRAVRNQRKLRRGTHAGNNFVITLRDFDGSEQALFDRVELIAASGVPNYFGPQRFGRNFGNLAMARRLFSGARLKRRDREFAWSAARAAIFNAIVSERVRGSTWNQFIDGDTANLDGRGSVFAIEPGDPDIAARADRGEIHPTGTLWGRGGSLQSGAARDLERAAAEAHWPYLMRGLASSTLESQHRALRLLPKNLSAALEGSTLKVEFSLPRGAFATTVLGEIVSTDSENRQESSST